MMMLCPVLVAVLLLLFRRNVFNFTLLYYAC